MHLLYYIQLIFLELGVSKHGYSQLSAKAEKGHASEEAYLGAVLHPCYVQQAGCHTVATMGSNHNKHGFSYLLLMPGSCGIRNL